MKRNLFFALLLSTAVWAGSIDANTVMEHVKWRNDGDSRLAEVTLKITDSDGDVRERSIDYVEKDDGKRRYTILYVKKPKDVRRTTILLINDSTHKNKTESDIWLYIPVLGKSKKLSSQNKSGKFVGSDFQYADLEWIVLEDFTYTLMGEEKVRGRNTYKIKATAADDDVIEKTGYSKKVLWVDPEYNLIVQADFYDKRGFYAKRLDVEDVEDVDGYWTVMRQKIENFIEEEQTEMRLSNVVYNKRIPNNLFRRQKLGKKITW